MPQDWNPHIRASSNVAAGDGKATTGALQRLRRRWLAPSPPLPVDDVPQGPSADPAPDDQDEGSETDEAPPAGG
jgi:hypothetical protein